MQNLASDKFIELVLNQVKNTTYPLTDADRLTLEFASELLTRTVLNETNLDEAPKELYHLMASIVVLEFFNKKRIGGTLADGFGYEEQLKSVTEGGRKMSFNVGKTTDGEFELLITNKRQELREQLGAFRRLNWW